MSDVFSIMLPSEIRSPGKADKYRGGGTLFLVIGIPWAMIAPHEGQALRNHSQSLRRLDERGGLSPCEALAVLDDRPWRPMDQINANAELVRRVAAFGETDL